MRGDVKKKNRSFPYPVLIFLPFLLFAALIGADGLVFGLLLLTVSGLVLWPFVGTEPEPPSEGDAPIIAWLYRLHTERPFRKKTIGLALTAVMVIVTGGILWYGKWLILWRAQAVLGLCALGLLWLLLSGIIRSIRKRREKKDRSSYPLPTVNMTFDESAAADGRAHALEARLRQLEEWRQSGMIGAGEYEALRERALRQYSAHSGETKQ